MKKNEPPSGTALFQPRSVLLRWSAGYFLCVSLGCILIGLGYLSQYRFPHQLLGIFYALIAFASHFALFGILPWILVIVPISLLFPNRRLISTISVIIASLIFSIELLDSQIFAAHRFHIDLFTIRILGWKTWGFGILLAAISIAFNATLSIATWKRFIIRGKKTYIIPLVILTVLMQLATAGIHIWADARCYTPVTRFTSYLPLFYPPVDKRYFVAHGLADLKGDRSGMLQAIPGPDGDFSYPRHPLCFTAPVRYPNIFILGFDGLRNDCVTAQLMPRIMQYAKSGTIFASHYSGGNSTRAGLFSLFYGLPATYYTYVESNHRSPLLIDRLQSLRYSMGIFTSAPLWAPASLEVTAFAKIPNLRMETKLANGDEPYRRDSAITQQWNSWLSNQRHDKPFFGFLFYDNASVPPAWSGRIPDSPGMSKMDRDFSGYKMCATYVDSLAGIVLDNLKSNHLLENTIVIITADHGNEFDDNHLGFTGHGSAFSEYQTHVPFIVLWLGKGNGTIAKRTSHLDMVATLMGDALGCTNPSSDYCSGTDLFTGLQWNWLIVGSYYNYAIMEPGEVTVHYPGGYFEIRDNHYAIIEKPDINTRVMKDAFDEMGRFFLK